jgi:sulfate adenylyltransferase subunit 1
MTPITEPSTTAPPAAVTLLRFATAGSVDDGKSTLVGRLLHDTRSVASDQLEAVTTASRNRGQETPDLALLTDGLRAEREQGITIDVAHRYFSTPRRRFILADTPGHVQYTRNMVTGASTAELAVVLVDARKGVLEQTRRHTAVAALLRVPYLLLAVNKMDLVGYREEVFAEISAAFAEVAAGLGAPVPLAVPVSALTGDNVVSPAARMDWYGGPSLLQLLETVEPGFDVLDCPARFPVQYVIRSDSVAHRDYRGYAGQITAGILRTGERVVALPSGRTSVITGIDRLGESVDLAWAPQSVALTLADELDISRGALIAPVDAAPELTRRIEATVCHLHEQPLQVGARVLVKHGARIVRGEVLQIPSRLGLDDLRHRPAGDRLEANDIGRLVLRTSEPLPVNDYADCRRTGAFLLIDPADGSTLTAGMVGRAFETRSGVDHAPSTAAASSS